MRLRRLLVLGTGLLAGPTALGAQATADQARLVFSVGLGQTSGGGNVWTVQNQPIDVGPTETDTLALSRTFRRSLAVVFSGTYFPGEHFGVNAEIQLLGLGTFDTCRPASALNDPLTTEVCNTIDGSERSATSATVSLGGIYRVASRQSIHPYVRANAGIVVSQRSFLRTAGSYTTATGEASEFTVYEDNQVTNLQPYLSAGGGVVAVLGKGYQLRFEVRDNWVRVPSISGATGRQGLVPASHAVGKHLLSFVLAFDVVLERKRGRRY
jgi:hypothetical protein